jgi:hypothetical protein
VLRQGGVCSWLAETRNLIVSSLWPANTRAFAFQSWGRSAASLSRRSYCQACGYLDMRVHADSLPVEQASELRAIDVGPFSVLAFANHRMDGDRLLR